MLQFNYDRDHHNSLTDFSMFHFFRKPLDQVVTADPASPDVMKENKEYIRKRRPINFTLADLENDQQEDVAFEYQNFDPMPSTSRALPSRICKAKTLYNDKSSSDNESDEEPEEEKAKFNEESTKNSTQNEVNDTTKEDEEKEATTKVWNEINEKICEYKVLIAKRRDYMKEQKLEQRYEESEAKSFQRVLKYIDNWSSDRPPEKLLMVVNWQIKSLKGSLPHSYFP